MGEDRGGGRDRVLVRTASVETPSAAEVAWLLLLPFVLFGIPLVWLLASPLGDVAFPRPSLHYWTPELVVRKSAVQAGYLLLLALVFAYGAAIVAVARRSLDLPSGRRRTGVLASQLLLVALIAVNWGEQLRFHLPRESAHPYFTAASVVAAAVVGVALVYGARQFPRISRAAWRRPGPRVVRGACLVAAVVTVVVWVLPAVYTDHGMAATDAAGQLRLPGELFGNTYYFDEATAVLNGRSPLVNMPAYGALWPYVIALPFGMFDGSYAAYTALMAAITCVAMLAVYDVLRRIAGALGALLLFVPFVATSFFIELGNVHWRYDPGNYFGIFPLRYAAPYLLAGLTAWTIARTRTTRAVDVTLFTAAALVVLNNVDFGLSALMATVVAVAITRRPLQAKLLAAEVVAGALLALALVSLLTLLREGSLPHLGLLGHYGRVFVNGGYGNIALHLLGWHVVLTITFVAALATAAARVGATARDRLLTAMLAWAGIFGLGASVYYYAYRSHPDVLVNIFSAWAFALALLTIVVLRAERTRERLPSLPALLVLFGFGLVVCSIAQVPRPWFEVSRIADDVGTQRPLVLSAMADEVRARTRPREPVALFVQVGHRVAREAGVVNVSPYPGLKQMPAREQLDDVLELLRREGGRTVFVGQQIPPGLISHLRRRGFERVRTSVGIGWSGTPVIELRRASG